jgi:hypothetical protein
MQDVKNIPSNDNELRGYLIMKIFRQCLGVSDREQWRGQNPPRLDYGDDIADSLMVMEYLKLIQKDEKSRLGWKETSLFMDLVSHRLGAHRRKCSDHGPLFLCKLLSEVHTTINTRRLKLSVQVLKKLGLVRQRAGQPVSTRCLDKLYRAAREANGPSNLRDYPGLLN